MLLVNAELAPKLHFCELVIGDLDMVVMYRVSEKSIWRLSSRRKRKSLTCFDEGLNMFLVILRLPNIFYDGSKDHVFLVDFD